MLDRDTFLTPLSVMLDDFDQRHQPDPHLPSVGQSVCGVYLVDTGFEGARWHQHWKHAYGTVVIGCPRRTSPQAWPKPVCRWLAGVRQSSETVLEKWDRAFRVEGERPPALGGFQARLAAKVAWYNCCFWLKQHLARPPLAFADWMDW